MSAVFLLFLNKEILLKTKNKIFKKKKKKKINLYNQKKNQTFFREFFKIQKYLNIIWITFK